MWSLSTSFHPHTVYPHLFTLTPEQLSFSSPSALDIYPATELSIPVRWLSCDVGHYPHLLTLTLWRVNLDSTRSQLSILATDIEDSGT